MLSHAQIPNLLTIGRAILTLIIIGLFAIEFDHKFGWILGLFLVASFTDFLDGYLARKYKNTSTFGAIFDPLIDKVLTLAVFCLLIPYGLIPAIIIALIIVRELVVDGLRSFLLTLNKTLSAKFWGKIKTTLQMVLIIISLYFLETEHPFLPHIIISLSWITLLCTYLSAIPYIKVFLRVYKDVK